MKMGTENIEAIMRRRWILFEEYVARMEDTRLRKCVVFVEMVGARTAWGAMKKSMGCFLDDLRAFGYQRRPVDDCSPGRGGMAQDGGTRGRNVSWRNGSLERKSGLEYRMQ